MPTDPNSPQPEPWNPTDDLSPDERVKVVRCLREWAGQVDYEDPPTSAHDFLLARVAELDPHYPDPDCECNRSCPNCLKYGCETCNDAYMPSNHGVRQG